MIFKEKTVWVVGASSGIGKAIAIDMAKLQANLVISSRKEDELNKVKEDCLQYTKNCMVIPLDLEDADNFTMLVNEVVKQFNTIDYLILSGGMSQRSFASETPIEIDRRIMEVNYFGNVSLTKAVLPYMIKQRKGHIVALSSIVGKFGFPLRSAYSASKHALHGYYETLRAEQKQNNISITIAIPGRVQTSISYNALLKDGSQHKQMDDGQASGISAELCSKKIIKAVQNNKKEVLIGGKEILMVWIRRFLPFLFYNFVNKIQPK